MSLRREVRDGVLILTIDRPQARNALDAELRAALEREWLRFRDDDALRVAVLTGAGTEAFCAGADLKELGTYYRSMTPVQRREQGEREPGLGALTRNFDPRKPTIAAINGACLAGGLEIALACDIRIASQTARFGLPEVRRGILPGAGGTQRLPRAVGKAKAMDMCLTARFIDAQEAERAGLVARIVPADKLLDEALAAAETIAGFSLPVVMMIKESVNRAFESGLQEGLLFERRTFHSAFALADQKEGMKAFVEKRKADFKNA